MNLPAWPIRAARLPDLAASRLFLRYGSAPCSLPYLISRLTGLSSKVSVTAQAGSKAARFNSRVVAHRLSFATMVTSSLPPLPASHGELVRHIADNPDKPMTEIMRPYREFEARLRQLYAQDRGNPILDDPHVNVLPLFTKDTPAITTRARDLSRESEEEKSRYIMALPQEKRRPHGSAATVSSIAEFQHNFNIFSESSLAEMDWSNVVAAGSSVVNCLLPVPEEFKASTRKLREYYHEKFCPASDVDLFLYGLTPDQAIEKIKQIERAVKDALLSEVTAIRTKHAITLVSQYPVRHVQIVLRIYKSVSEIVTGFDVDASGAYDGKQVYATPRALASFITQINPIDLSRRSPSYEKRLSKYSHRNFEIYCPGLDRAKVDPTIFERSFQRTVGLARLLVLERLPTSHAREAYLNKRREERGRPARYVAFGPMHGNIKDAHEDEVADWLFEDDVSNYHTFAVPYGEKFNAKRIEKLCYTRDLLLNAEWNQPKDRQVYLHRHPAFFGRVEDVIEDCCGCCPKAVTDEETEVATKEAEMYISGKVSFLVDDPGRQQIGSFNPIDEADWTDMAYVGDTARLCQSIVDGDIQAVTNWLSQEGADPNKRDHTGRTPLHLAVTTSTPEVVKCLVNHGSRLTARLADGRTALHLAAARGSLEMIRIIMEKSIENEEAAMDCEAKHRNREKRDNAGAHSPDDSTKMAKGDETLDGDSSDVELVETEKTDLDLQSVATGSFVGVSKKKSGEDPDDIAPEDDGDDPDFYQIDAAAWDNPCSPLHAALVEGHEEAVKLLCDYGADAVLPVKFSRQQSWVENAALLTLSLALNLPTPKASSMASLLLKLGATSSQADAQGYTAFHRFVEHGDWDLVNALVSMDEVGVKRSINHHVFTGGVWAPGCRSPLHEAADRLDSSLIVELLRVGASPEITCDTWLETARTSPLETLHFDSVEQGQAAYRRSYRPPLCVAISRGNVEGAMKLLESGASVNSLEGGADLSCLDLVDETIDALVQHKNRSDDYAKPYPPVLLSGMDAYLDGLKPGTYQHWIVTQDVREKTLAHECWSRRFEQDDTVASDGAMKAAISRIVASLESLRTTLVEKGAKTIDQLFTGMKPRRPRLYDQDVTKSVEPKYSYSFSFETEPGMTKTRQAGYMELMEAAWTGDLDSIKGLTLQAWGPEKDQPPLRIAIKDRLGNSPFSIAFLRRRFDVARSILEIVKAQWSPRDEGEVRFRMRDTARDDESEAYSEDEADDKSRDELDIESEKLDSNFTIDDIGRVSMQVESHVKPVQHICNSVAASMPGAVEHLTAADSRLSLFRYVIAQDDVPGLKFLLDVARKFSEEGEESGDDDGTDSGKFMFPKEDFQWAVRRGKTDMLSLIIKRTGAGVHFDHLVKKSGVDFKEGSKYYPGLTVYGTKRKGWANAGRKEVTQSGGLKTSPVLHAALGGSIDGVEFFLSNEPRRLYSEFGKSDAARKDARFKHLERSAGGFDGAISEWLQTGNCYVIHCALMSRAADSVELVRHLVSKYPQYLETKTTDGETPLMLACRLGRTECVKTLIDAGADQSTRNLAGENVLHACLDRLPVAAQLEPMLNLFDADLRSHLFQQRKKLSQDGTTPLHAWLCRDSALRLTAQARSRPTQRVCWPPALFTYVPNDSDAVETLRLILRYSKGAELDMLNGAGETCLHTATKKGKLSLVKVLVDFDPRQLYRENAVGRTPVELAHDGFLSHVFERPTQRTHYRYGHAYELTRKGASAYAAEAFVEKDAEHWKGRLEQLGFARKYSAQETAYILACVGSEHDIAAVDGALGLRGPRGRPDWANDMDGETRKTIMWDYMAAAAVANQAGKRRLVSLNEANDVARRLGDEHTGSRYYDAKGRGEQDTGDALGDKGKQENGGFVTNVLARRVHSAWQELRDDAEEDGGDGGGEDDDE